MRELVPQLRCLDDVNVDEDGSACCSVTGESWDILHNSIKKFKSSEAAGTDGLI